MPSVTFTSSGSWQALASTADCQAWGEGGGGAGGINGSHSGGGGGAGEYAEETNLALTVNNTYNFTIGGGGSNTNTSFPGDAVTVTAHFGASATSTNGASPGTGSTNSIHNDGGHGGNGLTGTNKGGGGGGGSGGSGGNGGNGGLGNPSGGAGGTAGAGSPGGAAGGAGGVPTGAGSNGSAPGGAGGGGGNNGNRGGGNAAGGQITLIYVASQSGTATLPGVGTLTAAASSFPANATSVTQITPGPGWLWHFARAKRRLITPRNQLVTTQATATLSGAGTLTALGGLPAPAVVNQWTFSYGQPAVFGTTPPALQSCVVPLTPAYSTGAPYSGVATPGNWLFTIVSWTQVPSNVTAHVGVGDDIHSWWREYPASNIGGTTRTSVSYTPNIARSIGNVYVAPDDQVTAISVLVVEVQGLGPWDTVIGTAAGSAQAGNYDAAVRADSPAAWWKLADAAGSAIAADSSGNGNTGTATSVTFGNASQAVPGNNSASFASGSSSHILTSYNPVLYQGVTVEAWVNLNGLAQSGNPRIIANSHTDVDDKGFQLMLSGTTPQVWFGNGTLTNHVTASSALPASGWTHLAGTWDENTVTLYVNGVAQGTSVLSGTSLPAGTASGTGIGYNPAYSGDYINGLLAECAVYPAALSAAKILGHYQSATGAASTSVSLSQAAGAQATFFIAGIGGDNVSSGQVFLPAGWTGLAAVSITDGTDHVNDNILTSAFLSSTLSNQNVSGTATTAENMSGFMLAVSVSGANPVPAGHNPNWPLTVFEAGFGGGFNTPNSEITWTDITSRLWSFNETTGIQFQLGQLQSTNLDLELDNFDGALSSGNTASPYFPNVTSGTPLRLRFAMSTIAGVTANRWYVIQRNAQQFPEEIDDAYRRFAAVTGTDIWAVLSSTGPTPYRGEVYADNPYSWYPCDDQPGPGGVLPTALLNAAVGNTRTLNIIASPAGVGAADIYTTTGVDATTANTTPSVPPTIATYQVGAQSGWMYGDPQSTPVSALAGNEITATPGSAAWQQTGLAGAGGSNTWFLAVNDTGFPALSPGVTVKGWFNFSSFGTAAGFTAQSLSRYDLAGQPYSPITLLTLATGSAPVAVLQLDISGHLNLITYNGTTGTSHSIYSGSDLRSGTFFCVDMLLTTTTWTVLVNAGLTASASGTAAGMTSAWTWLVVNGDLGTSGGSNLSAVQHGGNGAYSHITVFPGLVPQSRLLAHYCAAITGFGLLPAPAGVTLNAVAQRFAGISYTPDGALFQGSYGEAFNTVLTYTFSVLAVARAGGFTSGPSARAVISGLGVNSGGNFYGNAIFTGVTGLAPQFVIYTAASAAAETSAATILGSGDSFSSGFGAGSAGAGPWQTAPGGGLPPPAAASSLGDTVAQRIERVLGYGNVTSDIHFPGRCIDASPLLVQAALDVGGQQAGQNVQNIVISDGGLLFIDNVGKLNYWQRPHLAAQFSSPVWNLGPSAGRIPYNRDIRWVLDPQRAWNAIEIQPYSPSGAALPIITPSNGTAVSASQQQFGAQPFQVNSYLQSAAEMQAQADWLFANFGQPVRRAENVTVDAATNPLAWQLVLGVNVGDVVTLEDWVVGGGGNISTYRVTQIRRRFAFGDDSRTGIAASVTLTLDREPSNYWT